MWKPTKKITIICGHYGSGKTNLAVNLALQLAQSGEAVTLVDLDIVNPYFRAADNRKQLEEVGVRCIFPQFANTNVDIPTLPPDIYSVFLRNEKVIFDVGGDKDGAVALGMFRTAIERAGYEMIGVCNMYRPLTATAIDTVENLREIEKECGLFFTSVVNNSNLGEETTKETVEAALPYGQDVSRESVLPLLFTSVCDRVGLHGKPEFFVIRDVTKKIY